MTNIVMKYAILSVSLILCYGLEYNRHNPNTDFILNESRGVNAPKRDYVAPIQSNTRGNPPGNNRGNVEDFPPLGSNRVTPPIAPGSTTRNLQSTSGKRDYVAPHRPAQRPNNSGNNPGIAEGFPTLGSNKVTSPIPPANTGTTRNPQSSSGKPRPNTGSSQQTGTVKDLVNFYNNQGNNGPANVPSYSNVLRGTGTTMQGNNNGNIPSPVPQSPGKPVSFSTAVTGGATTPKPSTRITTSITTSRPIVLPSSLLNNTNQNTNSNGLSNAELQALSEELLRKDTNNAAKYITVNYQQKTSSQSNEDKAPLPLLTVAPDVWNIPTIQKLVPLLDNYERDTLVNEYVTPQERNEENDFMDSIMSTAVIRHLMNYLKDRGYVTPDPRQQRDFLKQLWFGMYSRGKGKISSSGFEHVFVSEFKNGDILGLHNWIYFSKEELANRLNYLGYLKYSELSDKGVVMKIHFSQQGTLKPVDSMFIGTSPELEIALYTLCFVTRAENDCTLKLGGKDVNIVTYIFRYRSKNYIASAYPDI